MDLLAEVRPTLEDLDCDWEDIYSAYYECEEDGTITFFEAESLDNLLVYCENFVSDNIQDTQDHCF